MKKHITVEVTPVGPLYQTVKVKIVGQTHIDSNFGVCGDKFVHKGFTLQSMTNPENRSTNHVFLRGTYKRMDNDVLIMPIAQYQAFKAAVEAYNAFFAVPSPFPTPKTSCVTVIG